MSPARTLHDVRWNWEINARVWIWLCNAVSKQRLLVAPISIPRLRLWLGFLAMLYSVPIFSSVYVTFVKSCIVEVIKYDIYSIDLIFLLNMAILNEAERYCLNSLVRFRQLRIKKKLLSNITN